MDRDFLPVVGFTALLAAAGASAAAAAAFLHAWPSSIDWVMLPVFLAVMCAAAHLQLRVPYGREIMALDLFEAVLAGAILIYPTPIVVGLVLVTQVIVETTHRNKPLKASFNVAQWMAAAGAGSLVFGVLRRDATLTPLTLGTLLVALAVVALVNLAAFSFVIRLVRRAPLRSVVRDVAPAIGLGWGANSVFGAVFVVVYDWNPFMIGLFVTLLLVLYGAYRGYATASADRARLSALNRAARVLAEPIDPRAAIPLVLEEILASFHASCVELVLGEGDRRVVQRRRADAEWLERFVEESEQTLAARLMNAENALRIDAAHPEKTLSSALEAEGWGSCITAPVRGESGVLGVLCVFDASGPEGFEEGELAVLEAVAGEIGAALTKGMLLERVFEERRKFAEVVNQTSDGMVLIDADGQLLMWNPAAERITGFSADEMVGTERIDELHFMDTQGREVSLRNWVKRGMQLPADLRIRTADGDARWLSCSYTQVLTPDARSGHLVVVARDTTRARELEQLKDDFVSTISHELRTPITPIKGWADLLLRAGDRLGAEQRLEAAQSIKRQADRLERLIINMLEVSRVEDSVGDRSRGYVDVGALATKVIEEFHAVEPSRTIALRMEGATLRARGDELWAEQILSNLVSNALKFSPADLPIDVVVSENEHWIELAVIDRGPGIPADEHERIFDRFHRLGSHLTRETSGTGLGLYIARRLAEAIGGSVSVESAEGSGASFIFRLRKTQRAGLTAVAG